MAWLESVAGTRHRRVRETTASVPMLDISTDIYRYLQISMAISRSGDTGVEKLWPGPRPLLVIFEPSAPGTEKHHILDLRRVTGPETVDSCR